MPAPFDLTFVLIQLGGGLVLLAGGAELLVRGAARLARSVGISPMAVGLTIVAFGTSSPEMTVSIFAALSGSSEIAIGNAVGSNIFNLAAILGLTALLYPIRAQAAFIRREIPIVLAVSLMLVAIAWDLRVERWEASVLMCGIPLYTGFAYLAGRREKAEVKTEFAEALPSPDGKRWVDGLLIAAGLVMLVGGSHFLVAASEAVARRAGLSETVIGLTLVAAGTSLPELAASLTAALRRQPDIALGNVIGSNVFNILAILGASAAIKPLAIPSQILYLDLPVMMAVTVVLWPMLASGRKLSRIEGAVLFAGYAIYTAVLILRAGKA